MRGFKLLKKIIYGFFIYFILSIFLLRILMYWMSVLQHGEYVSPLVAFFGPMYGLFYFNSYQFSVVGVIGLFQYFMGSIFSIILFVFSLTRRSFVFFVLFVLFWVLSGVVFHYYI